MNRLLHEPLPGTLSLLDKLEIRYASLWHNTVDCRNAPWSVTRHWKEATHAAGRNLMTERKRCGMASGPGTLVLALRKYRFPLERRSA
jgi:hypothetical protein